MWAELTSQHEGKAEFVVVDRDTDEGRAFADSHGIYYPPGFVVLDREGDVIYAGLGPSDPDDVVDLVDTAISQ